MAAEAPSVQRSAKTKTGSRDTEANDTVLVLNKESPSFKRAKIALATCPQDSLEGLTREEIKAVLAGKTRDEVIAQRQN